MINLQDKIKNNLRHFKDEWRNNGTTWKQRALQWKGWRIDHTITNFLVESFRWLPYTTGHVVAGLLVVSAWAGWQLL